MTNQNKNYIPETSYTTEELADQGYENPERHPLHEDNVLKKLIEQENLPSREQLEKDGYDPEPYYQNRLQRARERQRQEQSASGAPETAEAREDLPNDQAIRDGAAAAKAAGFVSPVISHEGVVMTPDEVEDMRVRAQQGEQQHESR